MNPYRQFGRLWCCHYTNETSGWNTGDQTRTCSATNCRAVVTLWTTFWLQGRGSNSGRRAYGARLEAGPPCNVGVRGGTRTRKTCVLSAVPMPIRLHGHLVGAEGVEPSPRGPRPRILPLYDTPMMKQAVFLLSGGPKKQPVSNANL